MRRPSPAVRICFATATQRAHFCDDAWAARRRSDERVERREGDIEAGTLSAPPAAGKAAAVIQRADTAWWLSDTRAQGTADSGTSRLTALASPLTSPSRTVTGTGGVSLKRYPLLSLSRATFWPLYSRLRT